MKYPDWIIKELKPKGRASKNIKTKIGKLSVNTVCESALCPNRGECYSHDTMTFMILGDICTRNCSFCAVKKGKPEDIDNKEIENVLAAVKKLGLKYVVITSVTRDDLEDEGVGQYIQLINRLRSYDKSVKIETLSPDYRGNYDNMLMLINSRPDVYNHNLETIRRLYPDLRPQASYQHSLDVLSQAKKAGLITKSGIMVGVGENIQEVFVVLNDLKKIEVDIVTIGQYIQPAKANYPVQRFIKPQEFEEYSNYGKSIGLKYVFSGPLVRSSYMAAEVLKNLMPT